MCAQAGYVSPGTRMTQALLVPLEAVNEEITESVFQAIWLGTRKLIKVGGALVIIKRGAIHGSFRFCFIY